MFQKGFTAHQVLSSAICIGLEMASSAAHLSTYLRDQLGTSSQTLMLKGERKEISLKNNGLTITSGLRLQNVIF